MSFRGWVVSIHAAPRRGAPAVEVPQARVVPGQGLEGDRHFGNTAPDRQLTLIEAEALEALHRDYGLPLNRGQARRQVVTRGVPLNHLVGREFRVGDVRLRGIRLCEPCEHLVSLTDPKVLRGLVHRGGLRAEILSEGVIRAGDLVRAAD
jgi:MOSC domain-containing protein YiiM